MSSFIIDNRVGSKVIESKGDNVEVGECGGDAEVVEPGCHEEGVREKRGGCACGVA